MKLAACAEDSAVLQQVLDMFYEGVVVIGRDGRIDFVNEALAVALGYRRDDLIGRLYLEILDHESMAPAMEGIERALSLPYTPPMSVTLKSASGRRFAVSFEGMGIRTNERGVAGVCCITRDLPPPPPG